MEQISPDSPTYGRKAGNEIMNMLKVSYDGNFHRASSAEEPDGEQGPREAVKAGLQLERTSGFIDAESFAESNMYSSGQPTAKELPCFEFQAPDGTTMVPGSCQFVPMTQFDMDGNGMSGFVGMAMQMPVMAWPQMSNSCASESPSIDSMEVPLEWSEVYTIMLRNIPNKYSQHALCGELNTEGYAGLYDFLYLPIDMDTNANKGYAFINFVDPRAAWLFKCQFDDCKMSRFNSSKVVKVVPAALQGLEANYAHYSTARVSRGDPKARPLFLRVPKELRRDHGNSGRDKREQTAGLAAQQRPRQSQPQEQIQVDKSQAAEAERRFCHFCGAKIRSDFKFCVNCGNLLDDSTV